jgi:hypothetical protein
MFLSVLPPFYTTSVKIWQRESSELQAVSAADFVLDRMEDDVRNARGAGVSSGGDMLVLALPLKAYDAALSREVNVLDANGSLTNGDQIQYYYTPDTTGTVGAGGTVHRRVVRANGTVETPRLVAVNVQPALNPLDATGAISPLFSYDADQRTVTITVTVAEPKASAGSFAPRTEVKCRHDGGHLVRCTSLNSSEGDIRCSLCGPEAEATAEIVTHQTQFMLRNQ